MNTRGAWLVSGLAGLAWLPFLAEPLSPDEGGFLLVASQWQPGTSLYGQYWVDRPPLLIAIFEVAAGFSNSPVALRLIGVLAVVASVLLTDRLVRAATGKPALVPLVVVGAFLTTPLFGTAMVNGELLAVPLVLGGVVALVRACLASGRHVVAWGLLAGAAGAAAPLVKQNVIDVLVVGAALLITLLRSGRRRQGLALGAAVLAGAALTTIAVLALAADRGTPPLLLWDALVTFRQQATSVILSSSTSSTSYRFALMSGAAVLSMAPVVLAVLGWRLRGRATVSAQGAPDLRAGAVALITWELFGVLAGGSYWLHYLIGLAPGLALVAVAAHQRPVRLARATAVAVGAAVLSSVVATSVYAAYPAIYSDDAAVSRYLREHSSSTDSVVVGFGHPNIVWDSGLQSPYDELWSLPVRVRDPQLTDLTQLLTGSRAPTWVVVNGTSLATWGVDVTTAQAQLDSRYQPVTTIGGYEVWRLRSATPAFR